MGSGSLTRHPSSTAAPAIEIEASAQLLAAGILVLRYRLDGAVPCVRLPPPGRARRADELWRRTCFEAFLKHSGSDRYLELNFSPSGEWAAYAFATYRSRLEPLPTLAPPRSRCQAGDASLELEATVQLDGLGALGVPGAGALDVDSAVGLSAVIEDLDGRLSYWALAHPRATPDFHDAAGWTGVLGAASIESRA
jgi:hypothetical protein